MRFIRSRKWVLTAIIALSLTTVAGAARLFLAPLAPYQYQPATISVCSTGGVILASSQGATLQIPFQGNVTFETLSNSNNPISTTLHATAFEGSGQNPELGNVTLRLSSQEQLSTITTNVPGKAFPATSRLTFDGFFTFSSRPDAAYSGTLTVSNTNITTWPHKDTKYAQEGVARFTNINNPDDVIDVRGVTVNVNAIN